MLPFILSKILGSIVTLLLAGFFEVDFIFSRTFGSTCTDRDALCFIGAEVGFAGAAVGFAGAAVGFAGAAVGFAGIEIGFAGTEVFDTNDFGLISRTIVGADLAVAAETRRAGPKGRGCAGVLLALGVALFIREVFVVAPDTEADRLVGFIGFRSADSGSLICFSTDGRIELRYF
jgi:hypothetical protein